MNARWLAAWGVALAIAALWPGSAVGQATDSRREGATCWSPGPLPGCRISVLTEVGGYVRLANTSHSRAAATADWGVLWNLGTRHAFGATLSVWVPDDAVIGPSLRYRYWLGGSRALDLSLGAAVWGNGPEPGSVFGLVRLNLMSWLALGVRAQHLRFDCWNPSYCPEAGRIFVGAEVGGELGRWLSLGFPALGLLWLLADD